MSSVHHSAFVCRTSFIRTAMLVAFAAAGAMPVARAQWNGASTGATDDASHRYTNTLNWVGGTINDSFSGFTFTGTTSLFFPVNHSTTGNVNTVWNWSGTAPTITFTTPASGGDVTFTLNGNWDHGSATANTGSNLTFNGNASTRKLILDLANATRTFNVVSDAFTIGANTDIINGGITKTGGGTLSIAAPVPISDFRVNGGTLSFSSTGGAANVSNFYVEGGASSTLAMVIQTVGNKFSDSVAIDLNRGGLTVTNTTGSAAGSETVGAIRLVQGRPQLTMNLASASTSLTLTASEIQRQDRSTAFLRPGDSATNRQLLGNGANTFLVGTAPTLTGGNGVRTTAVSVAPFLLSAETIGNVAGNTFVTYDSSSGFRGLTASEYVNDINTVNADGYDNVSVSTSQTLAADAAVNSIRSTTGGGRSTSTARP